MRMRMPSPVLTLLVALLSGSDNPGSCSLPTLSGGRARVQPHQRAQGMICRAQGGHQQLSGEVSY